MKKILPIAIVLSVVVVMFSDCGGIGTGNSTTPVANMVPHLKGMVRGGQQPVAYLSIQVWQVGTTGYGTGATPLIPAGSYFAGGAAGCVASGSQVCYPGVVSMPGGRFRHYERLQLYSRDRVAHHCDRRTVRSRKQQQRDCAHAWVWTMWAEQRKRERLHQRGDDCGLGLCAGSVPASAARGKSIQCLDQFL